MPLIECPDCRQQVSDAAQACPHCGRPIADGRRSFYTSAPARSAQLTPTVATAAIQPSMLHDRPSGWKCPQCGAVGSFRSLPELHADATSGGSPLPDVRERAAPPVPGRWTGGALVAAPLAGVVIGVLVHYVTHSVRTATIAGVVVAAVWMALARTPTLGARSYRARREAWLRSYLCTACGFVRETAAVA